MLEAAYALYETIAHYGEPIDSSSLPPLRARWVFFRDTGEDFLSHKPETLKLVTGAVIQKEVADGKLFCAQQQYRACLGVGLDPFMPELDDETYLMLRELH